MQENSAVLPEQNSMNRTVRELIFIIPTLVFYSSELLKMQVNNQLKQLIAVNSRKTFLFYYFFFPTFLWNLHFMNISCQKQNNDYKI